MPLSARILPLLTILFAFGSMGNSCQSSAKPLQLEVMITGKGYVEQPTKIQGSISCGSTSAPGNAHSGTSCSTSVVADGMVTLVATPEVGWRFDHWEGDCSGTDAMVTVKQKRDGSTCIAVFVRDTTLDAGTSDAP